MNYSSSESKSITSIFKAFAIKPIVFGVALTLPLITLDIVALYNPVISVKSLADKQTLACTNFNLFKSKFIF